ncbi:MAG: response regulator transcription factor [Cryobacterium sp.]|nr:response regulator transcription factor [Oligoflexia bacterium]
MEVGSGSTSGNTKVIRRQNLKPKLLIVDDEPEIREIVREVLNEHFEIIEAANGKEAINQAQRSLPDLILMDIMMPEMDGIAATDSIRSLASTRHIPILMLTAANTKDYRIRAFDFGADHFIGKPFDFEELTVRLLSVYKRSRQMNQPVKKEIFFVNLELNFDAKELKIDHVRIEMSPVEYDIVRLLVLNRETLVTRAQIIEEVWKSKEAPDRVMDAHIVSIRKKLSGFKGTIKTVYGSGYILRAE